MPTKVAKKLKKSTKLAKTSRKTKRAARAKRTEVAANPAPTVPSWFSGCEETETGAESPESTDEAETATNGHTHVYEGEDAKQNVLSQAWALNKVMDMHPELVKNVHIDGDPQGEGYASSTFIVDQRELAVKNGLGPYVLKVRIESIPLDLDANL